MKEVTGNLWDVEADVRVITTNGFIKRDGRAVMGRGVALQAVNKDPELPGLLGALLQDRGNVPMPIDSMAGHLITLPVKHNWYEPASLDLIETSIHRLVKIVDDRLWKVVVMPRPGCGNGQLDWKDVKPLIEPLLDDRFVIVNLPNA